MGQLAAKVRAKFPGAYDDLDDASLEKAVLAKHPEYADLAKPEPVETPTLIGAKSRITSDTTDAGPKEPDTWWGGFTKSLGDQAREMFVDNPITQGAAHPQSGADVASLLMPETPTAVMRTVGAAVKPAIPPIARAGAAAIESVPALRKVIPFADAAAGRLRTVAQAAQDANAGVTRGADMYAMNRQPYSTEATARVPMAHGEPMPITDEMRQQWSLDQARQPGGELARLQARSDAPPPVGPSLRTRFPNGLPIEPVPSHAVAPEMVPVGEEAAYNAAHAEAPAAQAETPLLPKDQILRDMRDPEMVQRAKEMQERAQAAPRLQRERMDVGAEKVGRAQGMTTDDVRAQAGPVLGEARGEASPVFPQGPFDRMAETLKALKPEDRLAYVMRAGDVKTQAQLETIRRVMAKYGLVIPAAVSIEPSVREMLLQRMRAGVTGEQ